VTEQRLEAAHEFLELVETVRRLRAPGGCPWDRQQTHDSLKRFAIEETYEMVEAVESGDPARLKDELGDVLLQVLLHAQIGHEEGEFDISDVCRQIKDKLHRRHPHVFGEVEVAGVDEVLHNWEQIKRTEPGYGDRESVLDGVPEHLPALMRAAKLGKKAAKTGFDWPDIQSIFDKMREETIELKDAIERSDRAEIKEEIGDLLFTIVNIARHADVDPEEALRLMLKKFIYRFTHIEDHARATGRDIGQLTLNEMDDVWNEAKGKGMRD
jgi:tetrapyrrole methylase family protein/MazG family protein